MADLPARVLGYIRKHALLRPGDRVGVAVSGGADSVALLRMLLELRNELGLVLSVVHFNHKLRGDDADADETFVRQLAARHGLGCHVGSGDTRSLARSNKLSIETAARELRYRYFQSLLGGGLLNKIATAHTLDDQAETVLMRILRGTGPTGLSGIYPVLSICHPERSEGAMHFAQGSEDVVESKADDPPAAGSIIRPFLEIRRSEIEAFLRSLHQPWCTDATNADLGHTRNRVRHQLLPLLERDFNPALRDRLSELAGIARAEEDYWQKQVSPEVERLMAAAAVPGTTWPESASIDDQFSLHLDLLHELPLAMQRRVLREAAKRKGLMLDFGELERILSQAGQGSLKVELRDRWVVSLVKLYMMRFPSDPEGLTGFPRSGRTLLFQRLVERHLPDGGYEYGLSPSGQVKVAETGTLFCARLVPLSSSGTDRTKQTETPAGGPEPGYNPSQLLNPLLLASELLIRNWRPGDRFWPAHTGSPKKVKELLQQKHVTGAVRASWPVVVSGDEIVWMRGYPVPEKWRAPEDAESAVLIEEVAAER